MEGYKLLNALLNHVEEFKQQMASLKQIKVLGKQDFMEIFPHFSGDNMGHDPLKILIDISELPYSLKDIH
ncbi:hypothetical protein R0J89_22885, partial [Psychrobacter sp. SIMBA_152]